MRLVQCLRRRIYVIRMMRAIEIARYRGWYANKATRTEGLLVIRTFERINGCAFDPANAVHLDMVRGRANEAAFFRSAGWVFKRHNRGK